MPKGTKIRGYGIICKHLDAGEYFFGADHKVYPCCFLYDEAINPQKIYPPWKYGSDFNDLRKHTIKEIKNHKYFSRELEESLEDKSHPAHSPRCWLSCGEKGKRITKKVVIEVDNVED